VAGGRGFFGEMKKPNTKREKTVASEEGKKPAETISETEPKTLLDQMQTMKTGQSPKSLVFDLNSGELVIGDKQTNSKGIVVDQIYKDGFFA
jgi:hypothetical protein